MLYSGVLAIAEEVEVKPGKWEDRITEYELLGEVKQRTEVLVQDNRINPGIRTNTSISVWPLGIGQLDNSKIRYVTYAGKKWTVQSIVDSNPTRLVLYIGEEYHGPLPDGSSGGP